MIHSTELHMGESNNELSAYRIYSKDDLLKIFPFGKTKMNELIQAGVLPVIKIGRDYLTNKNMINAWFAENVGEELYY